MLMDLFHSHTMDPDTVRSGCGQPVIKPVYRIFILMDSKDENILH